MRKVLIFLVLISVTIVSYGQIMFNYIPMGISYQDFKIKLQEKGFILDTTYSEMADTSFHYKGNYMSKIVDLNILVTPKTELVWKVKVLYPEMSDWKNLEDGFFDRCEQMKHKYGPPKNQVTLFTYPYRKGDGYELQAISIGKCTYEYYWEDYNGYVYVRIVSLKKDTAQIQISIEDKKASGIYALEKAQIIEGEK